MHRYLRTAFATCVAAALPLTARAHTQTRYDLETFDEAPAGIIQPGQSVKLEHFRVETGADSTAVIQPVEHADDLASGLGLGAPGHAPVTSIHLWFDKPRESVTFTIVLPPGTSTRESMAELAGPVDTQLQQLAIEHSPQGQRARMRMRGARGTTFDRLSLRLQAGAYIDGVKMISPVGADVAQADFDELPSQQLPAIMSRASYIVQNISGSAEIAPSSHPETWGQVLTSRASTDNDVTVIYRTRRDTLDLTVVPDPSGKPAAIEFLSGGDFQPLHTIRVEPKGGPQRLSYTADPGKSLQGVRWTGGKLRIDEVNLRSE